MNRRPSLLLTLTLLAAPGAVLAQDKAAPAAPVTAPLILPTTAPNFTPPAAAAKPAETAATPAPAETKPAEAPAAETKPAETPSADPAPAATEPKPADAASTEAKPAEATPAEAKPEPAKKKAAHKPKAKAKVPPAPKAAKVVKPGGPDPYAPTEVAIREGFEVGSIIVVSKDYYLYHVIAPGRAIRYGVAVGKDELVWKGRALVGRKVEWPSWKPTPEMIKRKPEQYGKYKDGMPGGPKNPLGARALYLHTASGNDTAIRIHGTTDPGSIGRSASNGCIRMRNEAVMDLFDQVPVGTPVYVY